MGVVAVDQHRLFLAQLRPARPAVIAHGAALVVMHHDPLADLGLLVADPRAHRGDDAARLVSADDRIGIDWQTADRRAARFRPAVLVQIAAAHARGLHLDHHLARTRGRIGELHHLDFPLTREHYAVHRFLRHSLLRSRAYALSPFSGTTCAKSARAAGRTAPVSEVRRGA